MLYHLSTEVVMVIVEIRLQTEVGQVEEVPLALGRWHRLFYEVDEKQKIVFLLAAETRQAS